MPDMPWSPRTPQEQGHATERRILRKRGARAHPRSGAGRIKLDGSDDQTLIEVKSANRQITLDGAVLKRDLTRASHQGKALAWIIAFGEAGIEAEITVRRV